MNGPTTPAPVGGWFWCTTHRQPHRSDQHADRGCTLAGPFTSQVEAETFSRRTDPEAFDE
jgi:hypothetical protein